MRMDDDDNDDDTTTTAITTAGGTPARKKAKRKPPPPPEILESPEVAGGTVPEAAAASTASTASTAKKRTPAVAPLLQVDGLVDDSCKTKRDRPKRSKPEPRIARSKASLLREAGKLPPPPPPPPSSPSPSPVSASATAAGQAQPLPQQRPGLADPQSDGWPHTAKHEFFLTPTEIAVMEGVISGMKDCGIQMAIALNSADPDRMRSRSTVRAHLRHIFRKTGQAKRASAVAHILLKHIELQQTFIDQLHSEIDRLTEENQRLRGGGEQKIMKRMAGKK